MAPSKSLALKQGALVQFSGCKDSFKKFLASKPTNLRVFKRRMEELREDYLVYQEAAIKLVGELDSSSNDFKSTKAELDDARESWNDSRASAEEYLDEVFPHHDSSSSSEDEQEAQSSPVPKLNVPLPDKIHEGITYRQFRAWKESWENYAECVQLSKQPRLCQVSAFWGQCSSGFLGYVRNYLGIERSTTKSLATIVAEIGKDLKSQVNVSKVRLSGSSRTEGLWRP